MIIKAVVFTIGLTFPLELMPDSDYVNSVLTNLLTYTVNKIN